MYFHTEQKANEVNARTVALAQSYSHEEQDIVSSCISLIFAIYKIFQNVAVGCNYISASFTS